MAVLTALDLLAVTLAIGAAAGAAWLVPPQPAVPAEVYRNLRRLIAVSLMLMTLTTPAVLLARSLQMSGAPLQQVMTVAWLVITRTDFGHVWSVRAALLPLLWLVWNHVSSHRHSPVAPRILLALMAMVAWTRGATGHAGNHGDFRLAVWIDGLHLYAAGLWGGVIFAFILAVRPALSRKADHAVVWPAIVARLSTLAAIGLISAVATGLYSAWHELAGWRPLWVSRYGRILDVKLVLVIVMAWLGARNRFRHVPLLTSAQSHRAAARSFRRIVVTVTAEALLMLAILAVIAVLVQALPPAALPPEHGLRHSYPE